MTKEIKKDSKRCTNNKKIILAYQLIQIGSSSIASIALVFIAFGFFSINYESRLFNQCVEEIIMGGSDISKAVHFCNGGN